MRLVPVLLPVVVANAVTVWLMLSGRLSILELLLLISLETLGLHLIGGVSDIARMSRRRRRREGLLRSVAGLLWRTGFLAALIAVLWLFQIAMLWIFAAGVDDLRRLLEPLALLAGSELVWPLALTLAGAVWDAFTREHAEIDRQSAARLMTLVLGVFPFIAPVLVMAGATVREIMRGGVGREGAVEFSPRAIVLGAITGVLVLGVPTLLPVLLQLGARGWMISFLSTKIVLEVAAAVLVHQARDSTKRDGRGEVPGQRDRRAEK